MQDEATARRRAIQALLDELAASDNPISEALVQQVYDIEERVQFLDDRGSTPDRLAKVVQAELENENAE